MHKKLIDNAQNKAINNAQKATYNAYKINK